MTSNVVSFGAKASSMHTLNKYQVNQNLSMNSLGNNMSKKSLSNIISSINSNSITSNLNSKNKVNTNTQATSHNQGSSSNAQLVPQQSISSSGTDGSKTDLRTLHLRFKSNELIYSPTNIGSHPQQNNQQQLHVGATSMGVTFDSQYQSTSTPYSYQVTSMNESKAKQICKKRATDAIW